MTILNYLSHVEQVFGFRLFFFYFGFFCPIFYWSLQIWTVILLLRPQVNLTRKLHVLLLLLLHVIISNVFTITDVRVNGGS